MDVKKLIREWGCTLVSSMLFAMGLAIAVHDEFQGDQAIILGKFLLFAVISFVCERYVNAKIKLHAAEMLQGQVTLLVRIYRFAERCIILVAWVVIGVVIFSNAHR